jgi:hypothetical protein
VKAEKIISIFVSNLPIGSLVALETSSLLKREEKKH